MNHWSYPGYPAEPCPLPRLTWEQYSQLETQAVHNTDSDKEEIFFDCTIWQVLTNHNKHQADWINVPQPPLHFTKSSFILWWGRDSAVCPWTPNNWQAYVDGTDWCYLCLLAPCLFCLLGCSYLYFSVPRKKEDIRFWINQHFSEAHSSTMPRLPWKFNRLLNTLSMTGRLLRDNRTTRIYCKNS